jgi:RhtB (resistance to homoserine/threonine) family protein
VSERQRKSILEIYNLLTVPGSPYLATLFTICALQTVAVISPGPDFAMVVRNSLLHSRQTALWTVAGIAGGIFIHVGYSILGLGYLIRQMPWILTIIQVLGCSYLGYIGIKGIRAKAEGSKKFTVGSPAAHLSARGAFKMGFLTNALNPKAILFFLSIFTSVAEVGTPKGILMVYGMCIVGITLIWFTLVSLIFSGKKFRNVFLKYSYWIDRVTGTILLIIALKLLVSAVR